MSVIGGQCVLSEHLSMRVKFLSLIHFPLPTYYENLYFHIAGVGESP